LESASLSSTFGRPEDVLIRFDLLVSLAFTDVTAGMSNKILQQDAIHVKASYAVSALVASYTITASNSGDNTGTAQPRNVDRNPPIAGR
jgi:isopentenyl phosphate kinase